MYVRKLILLIVKQIRLLFYSVISTKKINCRKVQPVLFNGKGKIVVNNNVVLGVEKSPGFYSSYIYIDARNVDSYIEIGENCIINNNATITSDGMRIVIKSDCLIGYNLEILDSDFHGKGIGPGFSLSSPASLYTQVYFVRGRRTTTA